MLFRARQAVGNILLMEYDAKKLIRRTISEDTSFNSMFMYE